MRKWRAGVRGVVVGVVALALLPCAPAVADDPYTRQRQVRAQLSNSKDDLDEASAEVRAAATALAAVAVRLPKAEARLAEVEGRLAAARAGAEAAGVVLAAAQADLTRAEAAYAAAQRSVEVTRRKSGELARAVYMTGPGGFAATLLNAGSPSDFAERVTYVHALLSDGTGRVRAATDARADLASRAGVLAVQRAGMATREQSALDALARVEQLANAAQTARDDVARQLAARRTALRTAEHERAADLTRYRALQRESARLAELIRRASRGSGRVGRGGMLWPTPGTVTSGFGWRIHPIYGYRRFHPGIDIGAPTGQSIVAVLPGVVVSAGPMGTYGNIVVIDHGDGFATAYAHQSRILVVAGQHVAKGQRIGLVGSTGASTGPHLHFETRVNGEPVNPLNYY